MSRQDADATVARTESDGEGGRDEGRAGAVRGDTMTRREGAARVRVGGKGGGKGGGAG
jgi:hypothetical protein